jgi:hypothetical protein
MTTPKTSKTPKKPSKAVLKRSIKLVQACHDYIEANGFDIYSYDSVPGDAPNAPRCYIGTTRCLAGVKPMPHHNYVGDFPADEGDGSELTFVLGLLDSCAKRTKYAQLYKIDHDYRNVGRYIEMLGLRLAKEGVIPSEQTKFALTLFRRALRDLVKKLEKS